MKHTFLLIAFLCLFTGISAGLSRADDAQSHTAKGVIEKIPDDKKTVSIQNDDIPGYMSSMTMDYSIKAPTDLSGLKAGDKITFKIESTDSGLVAADIKKSN